MTAQVTHARTEVPEDSDDAELIQPSDFTAEHTVRGVLVVTAQDAITITGLLADRALIEAAPDDMTVVYAGVAVGMPVALDGGSGDNYRVRIWHEADWTIARVSPVDGVLETRMAVHQQAIWASLLVVSDEVEFNYVPWAANTGMATDKGTSGGGSLWVVDTPGTTGGSAPDWENPVEGAVTDGSVVWLYAGDAPASGTIRPYLLTFQLPV